MLSLLGEPFLYFANDSGDHMVLSLAVLSTALPWWRHDAMFAAVMAAVAITTWPVRRWLMPAVNRATDAGLRRRYKWLHGLSVVVTLGYIAATGWLLAVLA